MSEKILRALMQLFAIVAMDDNHSSSGGRSIVRQFLAQILSQNLVEKYLGVFDEFTALHKVDDKNKKRKKTAVNSVKLLKICAQINEELEQKQKIIVVIRLLEFIFKQGEPSDQDFDFLDAVSDSFNIEREEYLELRKFVASNSIEENATSNLLIITGELNTANPFVKQIQTEGVSGTMMVLCAESVNMYLVKHVGAGKMTINGMPTIEGEISVLSHGAAIKTARSKTVYFSDIVGAFSVENAASKIYFTAKNVEYRFPNGNRGLHDFNLNEETGHMVGIMGGSGSGKSTLLNILNGNYTPSKGSVTLNGIDIHREKELVEGQIGYVAQDDLLIEELTVFQNLFYTAKLCFGNKTDEEISEIVLNMLSMLGLSETRELKVGNPLQKTISGGQRKRLNIALELIREPAVLFVDEPTSGLSSRDSENIMNLLKELSLKGKLIFVVIHQPSSQIFKLFDRLLVMDQGGYPVYNGNPVDSIRYFKKHASHASHDDSECHVCGNVNPELIFNIIEAKMVDEYGQLSENRKEDPAGWNKVYTENISSENVMEADNSRELPETSFKIPDVWSQFKVFLTRDVLSKLTNRQYMLINMLEAPVLAAILAFFLKYFASGNEEYVFRLNENIPQYIFISVIVALFIGLTVSSEEIIRDKRIRARESFLNLSKSSYLFSKITVMLVISAIQMLLFTLVGNFILEIKGMYMAYWIVLFSTASFANILGLNISASFNSAKVIYILIPIMIIPQLLFSGIIVKFDKLHPYFASQKGVPMIGNIMASRWAYEALAVRQYKDNEFEKDFYYFDYHRKYANWKKDNWKKEIQNKLNYVNRELKNEAKKEEVEGALELIYTELKKETEIIQYPFEYLDKINYFDYNNEVERATEKYLNTLNDHYKKVFNTADAEKEKLIFERTKTAELNKAYVKKYNDYSNESLEYFVTNRNDLNLISEHNNELIQKTDLIYAPTFKTSFFDSHFYAPSKNILGSKMDTFWANVIVLWGMFTLLCLTLFFDVFNKIGGLIQNIMDKKRK